MRFFFSLKILFCLLLSAGCSPHVDRPVSDHFDGKRFYNPGQPMRKGFGSLLRWQLNADPHPWPDFQKLATYDKPPERVHGQDLRIGFVGHVSVLIQTEGLNILTDPVWSKRASPVQWAGPKRVHPPGIHFDDLPKIDIVLVSHNHYDHLDLATLRKIYVRDKPRIIMPIGNEYIFTSEKMNVEYHDWGDTVAVRPGIDIHLEPMHHWSARGLFDRNRALWATFVIQTPGGNIYFVGDSGYGDGSTFRSAKKKFGSFRLALLPIGSYAPRWFMSYGHMNPEESLQALQELGLPFMLPMHYGIFQLSDTGYDDPLRDLQEAIGKYPMTADRVHILQAGQSWMVPQ